MAVKPNELYSGQVDTSDSEGYPYGAAKNVSISGDGTGTPLEKEWLSDLFGFWQALLDAANITPTGTPDKVGASQYLDAIQYLIDLVRAGVPGKADSIPIEVPTVATANVSSRFSYEPDVGVYYQTDITDQGKLTFALPLPTFGKLQEVRAVITGAVSPGERSGGLPANKPSLRVDRRTHTIGGAAGSWAQVSMGTATDAPASTTAYEEIHELALTGIGETLSPTDSFYIVFRGESGANALANKLQLLRLYCVVTL